jgi:hypothetical protein
LQPLFRMVSHCIFLCHSVNMTVTIVYGTLFSKYSNSAEYKVNQEEKRTSFTQRSSSFQCTYPTPPPAPHDIPTGIDPQTY